MSEETKDEKNQKNSQPKKDSKTKAVVKSVVIKNVGQDYQTVEINGDEQILYTGNEMTVRVEDEKKAEKLKSYLETEYGDSLNIQIQ